jgi:uncharacterized protein
MPTITPRVPDIDWAKGFDRHWCGGSPTMTHWYNAISFLLPTGEQFFRDVAREVADGLDLSKNPQLEREVREFAIQESLHAAQHRKYNAVLETQGFKNFVDPSIVWWKTFFHRHCSPLTNLAAVCAYEHYTAILAENLLRAPKKWMQSSPDMALFWGWHAAEETEHKAVCFDLYTAAGGGWLRRALVYLIISIGFNFFFFGRAYFYLIRTDGCLRSKQLSGTVASKPAWRAALFGPVGFAVGSALHYLSPRFHPWRRDNRAHMEAWLRTNAARLRVVTRNSETPAPPSAS